MKICFLNLIEKLLFRKKCVYYLCDVDEELRNDVNRLTQIMKGGERPEDSKGYELNKTYFKMTPVENEWL